MGRQRFREGKGRTQSNIIENWRAVIRTKILVLALVFARVGSTGLLTFIWSFLYSTDDYRAPAMHQTPSKQWLLGWPRLPSFLLLFIKSSTHLLLNFIHASCLLINSFILSYFLLYLFIHSLTHQFTCSFILRIIYLLIYLFTCSLFALSLTPPLHFSSPPLLIFSLIYTLANLYITPSIHSSTYPSHIHLSLHPSIHPPTSALSGLMLILKIKKWTKLNSNLCHSHRPVVDNKKKGHTSL